MSIQINPTFIAGAIPYDAPVIANTSNLCAIPKEGFKTVSMQFLFTATPRWYVDMSAGNPTPPLSQVCALYIDAAQCFNSVYIYFPDTGYSVFVTGGDCMLIPVITGKIPPKFYVLLVPNFLNPALAVPILSNDIVNIIAMNQFVPEFNSVGVTRAINYGLGSNNFPIPILIGDSMFTAGAAIAGATDPKVITVFTHSVWFLKFIDISIIGNTTDGSTLISTITIFNNAVAIMQKQFILNGASQFIQLFNTGDINYPSGTGALSISIVTGGVMNATLSYNFNGGISIA